VAGGGRPRPGVQHRQGSGRLPGPALGEHLVDGQLPPAALPPAR
jgi:hypothetical protein